MISPKLALSLSAAALACRSLSGADPVPVTVRHPDVLVVTGTDGDARNPVWAAGSRYVFFVSDASNLVSNDGNGPGLDLFRHDRQTGETLLVSAATDSGVGANGPVLEFSVSSDGTRAVWLSDASNLVSGDTNAARDVFLRDIAAGTTTLVSWNLDRSGTGRGASFSPVLSADGRRVIYGTRAENVQVGLSPSSGHRLCLRDVETQTVTIISEEPWLFEASANLEVVVYATEGSVVPSPDRTPTALMVWRFASGVAERLWLRGAPPARLTRGLDFSHLCLTPSGRHLAFAIPAEGGDAVSRHRGLWRADLQTGESFRVWDPQQAHFSTRRHWMSVTDDGSRIAFLLLLPSMDDGEVKIWTEGAGIQTLADLVTSGVVPEPSPRRVEGVHFSPEGTRLMFFTQEPVPEAGVHTVGDSRAYLRTLNTGETRTLVSGETDIEAAFDPSGDLLAFSASELSAAGLPWKEQSSVWVLGGGNAPPTRISNAIPAPPSSVASASIARVIGLSDDGQQILFRSHAPDIFPGANTLRSGYFCFDVQRATNRWINGPAGGISHDPNAWKAGAAIAASGRSVVFGILDTNLIGASRFPFRSPDLLIRNLATDQTVLATPKPRDGFFSHLDVSSLPEISGDGQRVHLRWSPGYDPYVPVIFDQKAGYLLDVTRFGWGSPVAAAANRTTFSRDGRRTAYATGADSEGKNRAGWLDMHQRVAVETANATLWNFNAPLHVDTQADRLIIETREFYGLPATIVGVRVLSGEQRVLVAGSEYAVGRARVATGGSLVVFTGKSRISSNGFVPIQVFARPVAGGPVEHVSIGLEGFPANGDCRSVGVSADGRFVVFTSRASNLVPGDINEFADVFVRDRYARVTHLLSRLADGSQEDGHCAGAVISGDGRTVAFTSFGRRLAPGDGSREPTILRVAVPDAAVVDSDADGLPDVWELDHLQTLAHGADGDADSDGQTNRDEFIARTLPGEPASLLAMFSVEAIAGGFDVTWQGHAAVTYQLERHHSLSSEAPWVPVGAPQSGYEGLVHQAIPGLEPGAYYRVTVVAP